MIHFWNNGNFEKQIKVPYAKEIAENPNHTTDKNTSRRAYLSLYESFKVIKSVIFEPSCILPAGNKVRVRVRVYGIVFSWLGLGLGLGIGLLWLSIFTCSTFRVIKGSLLIFLRMYKHMENKYRVGSSSRYDGFPDIDKNGYIRINGITGNSQFKNSIFFVIVYRGYRIMVFYHTYVFNTKLALLRLLSTFSL